MKTRFPASLLLVALAVSTATVVAASSVRPRQIADLKSFFHGDTMPPKAPPPPVTATVATAAGVTPDKQVEEFFRAFAAAVKARDGASMLPRLAEQYTIAGAPEGSKASDFFAQGVDRTPGPETIVIQSVELKGSTRMVKAELRYPAKIAVKTFHFNTAGKLLASDLFTLKRVEHGL